MASITYNSNPDSQTCSFNGEGDDLKTLREHPLVRYYAEMSDDCYNLVKETNPTLKLFVDVARAIVEESESE